MMQYVVVAENDEGAINIFGPFASEEDAQDQVNELLSDGSVVAEVYPLCEP